MQAVFRIRSLHARTRNYRYRTWPERLAFADRHRSYHPAPTAQEYLCGAPWLGVVRFPHGRPFLVVRVLSDMRRVLWKFEAYLFVIFFASLHFLACSMLFPDSMEGYSGYEDYFMSRRAWFFGILVSIFICDFLDTAMKGMAHFRTLGAEYPFRNLFLIALFGLGIYVRREKIQLVVLAFLNSLRRWRLSSSSSIRFELNKKNPPAFAPAGFICFEIRKKNLVLVAALQSGTEDVAE